MRRIILKNLIVLSLCLSVVFPLALQGIAKPMPFNPNSHKDNHVFIDHVQLDNNHLPIFSFYNKMIKMCETQNICLPGLYNNYVPVTNVVIFKGEEDPRLINKDNIMWQLKFLEFAPTKLTYGQVPSTARQIVKAKPLERGEVYSMCIFAKNSPKKCVRWDYPY